MEEIRETITHNSDYPDEHERLVKVWEQYNKEFFNGELSPPKILLIELQNEVCSIDELKLWGLYRWVNGESIIAVNACMFRLPITNDSPAYDEFKFRIASDTFLHEMVHQQISETNQYDVNCPSSKHSGLLSLFLNGGSGSSWFDVKPLYSDGSSGGFGLSGS